MTSQSLREQIAAARSGSQEAFAALVGHYQGLVSATTLNIVGDFQQSEDIAQEAFLIAWNQLKELSDPQKFPAWLCGIARNCSKNWLRRQKRNPLAQSVEISDVGSVAETEQPGEVDAQLVWRSLADIPETYREPMLMFYRHGAKIAEIADALELTEEAVRQRLSRGRKLLKSEVERTVEKTLAATRPDTAFTLAVLAAIPLSASVGCSTTSPSLGFMGGISTMSGYGTIGIVLSILVGMVLMTAPTILLAAVCFYAFWYAVKNSPTPRTRRFVVSAALDLNVLFWLMSFAKRLAYSVPTPSRSGWWFDLFYFFKMQLASVRYFLFDHLPMLLVFSAFVVYIVLRWRQILYEDRTEKEPGTERSAVPGLLAHNFCLTAYGLCVKRNVVFGLVAVFLTYNMVTKGNYYWRMIYHPGLNPSSGMIAWLIMEFVLLLCLAVGLYAVFFRLVSKAIGIAQDETALEQTPPRISVTEWSESELRPEGRRQMLVDCFFLLGTVPLMLLLINLGAGIAQESLFARTLFGSLVSMRIGSLLQLQVALVVLTVLWCSHHPAKRLLGFSCLFLVSGLLAFGYIEQEPLRNLALQYYLTDFFDWLSIGRSQLVFQQGLFEYQRMYLSWHLTAVAFLVYSLLAAAFCYFLQPVSPFFPNGDDAVK